VKESEGGEKMKKEIGIAFTIFALFMLSIVPALAIKPENNTAGAQEYMWYLSADLMKVPPYGSGDIPGSDTASKLIVNQPNGAVELALTGVMKGLNPNSLYQVYIGKGYTLNYHRYSLLGDWSHEGWIGAAPQTPGTGYQHNWVVTSETDTTFSGTGAYHTGSPTWTFTGTKSGNGKTITMNIDYDSSSYWATLSGTIQNDGSISGTWEDSNSVTGTWKTFGRVATLEGMIGSGYPGDLDGAPTEPELTFTTDEFGSGSWHMNLRDSDFPTPTGNYVVSVWINGAGRTILISDNIDIIVGE
jgi:hypothetical protein